MLTFLLLLASIIGSHAQYSATVYVESSEYYDQYYILSTEFVGIEMNSGGVASITFEAGDEADCSYVISYADDMQSTPSCESWSVTNTFTAAGTYWLYIANYGTTVNEDYIQIRVVANGFEGTISPLYSSPPSGWGSGYPPIIGGMSVINRPPNSLSSSPASTASSITQWLVPVLIVTILLALSFPIGYYVYQRVQKKKNADKEQQRDQHDQAMEAVQMTVGGSSSNI